MPAIVRKIRVAFMASKKEKEALSIMAQNEGVKEAALMRYLIREEAKRKGIWTGFSTLEKLAMKQNA